MVAGKKPKCGFSPNPEPFHFRHDSTLILIKVQSFNQRLESFLPLTCLRIHFREIDEKVGLVGSSKNSGTTKIDAVLKIVFSQSYDEPIVGKIERVFGFLFEGHAERVG